MCIFKAQAFKAVNLHIGFCTFTIKYNFMKYPHQNQNIHGKFKIYTLIYIDIYPNILLLKYIHKMFNVPYIVRHMCLSFL